MKPNLGKIDDAVLVLLYLTSFREGKGELSRPRESKVSGTKGSPSSPRPSPPRRGRSFREGKGELSYARAWKGHDWEALNRLHAPLRGILQEETEVTEGKRDRPALFSSPEGSELQAGKIEHQWSQKLALTPALSPRRGRVVRSASKSLVLTKDGEKRARELFEKLFSDLGSMRK